MSGNFTLPADRPAIMGIVNVTPDSFSDGGLYLEPAAAVEHALRLAEEGADIIDIGGESTRPGADPVDEERELGRILPVVEGVRRSSAVPISVDTTKGGVARRALEAGADMINDVSAGLFDPSILSVAAERGARLCLMHMKGTPRTMQAAPAYDDLIAEIKSFLADALSRACAAGVERGLIAVDPGIGFGKAVEHNMEILRRLTELRELGAVLAIGASRKSFIGKVLNEEVDKRLEGSLAALAAAINGGAGILRVHDVAESARFVKMYLGLRP